MDIDHPDQSKDKKGENVRPSLWLFTEGSEENQPFAALRIFSGILNNMAVMSQKHLPGDVLDEALSESSTADSGMDLLRVMNDLMSAELLETNRDWQIDGRRFQDTYLQVGSSIVEILSRFFALILKRFQSSVMRSRWADTCNTFLDELKRAIDGYRL